MLELIEVSQNYNRDSLLLHSQLSSHTFNAAMHGEHVTFVKCSDGNQAIEISTGVGPAPVEHFPASTVRRKSSVAGQFV
jgi:hypothetical protein